MEKKGDLFNQLAIISDLLEKANVESKSQTIVIELPEKEFYRIYKMVESRVRFVTGKPQDTFNVRIGDVNIVFNMSNV
jgi:CRP-like cAMP-binding protein